VLGRIVLSRSLLGRCFSGQIPTGGHPSRYVSYMALPGLPGETPSGKYRAESAVRKVSCEQYRSEGIVRIAVSGKYRVVGLCPETIVRESFVRTMFSRPTLSRTILSARYFSHDTFHTILFARYFSHDTFPTILFRPHLATMRFGTGLFKGSTTPRQGLFKGSTTPCQGLFKGSTTPRQGVCRTILLRYFYDTFRDAVLSGVIRGLERGDVSRTMLF
jgi:hypothetical protein